LGDLTKDTPKPMLVIAGKPVVEHIMDQIKECGIKDFALVTRYLHEKIEGYFGDGSKFGMNISYIPQPERYGTGAALYAAKDFLGGDEVMMTFGDVICSPDSYKGTLDVFLNDECDGAMALNWVDDPYKGAAVLVDEEKNIVTQIKEKPKPGEAISNWMNSGISSSNP
jgi:NDP-sugar pyrophosphorylase family protein